MDLTFVNLGTEFHEKSFLDGCLQAVLDHGLKKCCLPGTIYPDLLIVLYTAQSPEMHRFREGQLRKVVAEKNRTTEGLFLEVLTYLFFAVEFISCNF